MSKDISIIIPVWNREDKVLLSLQSIERQTFKNLEVIIVDDGSTDNTVNVINDFIEGTDLDIKLYPIEHSGVSIARNYGIDKSTGKYIFFLDSDDYIFKSNFLEDVYNLITTYDIDIIYTKFYYKLLPSKKLGNYNCIYNGIDFVKNLNIIKCNYNPSLYFCKKEFLNKYNIRFAENLYMEDILFLFDLAYYNAKFYIADMISVIRTISDNSITNGSKYDYHYIFIFKKILDRIKLKYDKLLYENYYITFLFHLENVEHKIVNTEDKYNFNLHLSKFKELKYESDITNTSN